MTRQLTLVTGVVFLFSACHSSSSKMADHGDGSAPRDGSADLLTDGSSHADGASNSDGSSPTDGSALTDASSNTDGGSSSLTAWCASHASSSAPSLPGNDAAVPLVFAVDLCKGPARQYAPSKTPVPVSPYIYGINADGFVATSTRWGLIRQGGDDNTPYNWSNDYSNSGADYCYYQGASTTDGNLAGRYTDPTGDTIPTAHAKGEAFLATIPILDFVAASYDRNTGYDTATNSGDVCPGTDSVCSARSGTVSANVVDKFQGDPNFNSTLTFAYKNDGTTTTTGSPAFVKNVMTKGSALCTCAAGTTSCSGCSVGTNPVAQDEFVSFLETNYGKSGAPLFFDLDNEPNDWVSTHPELYPNNCSKGSVTWDDIANRDIKAATAIKSVAASAKVFGPVVTGDGMAYGGDYSSPHFVAGTTEFTDWFLAQVVTASVTAKRNLLDVLDVHYYTVGNSDAECLESPRLFWDPNATDISAANTNSLDFDYGDHSYWDKYWYPRQVIPRLFKKIAAAYAGKSLTPPTLSFSEYNPGCENAISGGVAEADLLGIFGREGVFAATVWPLEGTTNNYLEAAFELYRNYDGAGAVVGDTAVLATSTDYRNTSVYAFTNSADVLSTEVVAINKLATAVPVTIQLTSSPTFQTAKLYNLVTGKAGVAAATGSAPKVSCENGACTVTFTMPATSATTVVLR